MKNKKWSWRLDQYLEDKFWPKVYKQTGSLHFIFFMGLICGCIISFLFIHFFLYNIL